MKFYLFILILTLLGGYDCLELVALKTPPLSNITSRFGWYSVVFDPETKLSTWTTSNGLFQVLYFML
jgi:hypothetical protein